jgi:acyl carrier protein
MPGWNSMHILLLVAMIDFRYQVLLSGEHLKTVETVNDLFDLVKQKQHEH